MRLNCARPESQAQSTAPTPPTAWSRPRETSVTSATASTWAYPVRSLPETRSRPRSRLLLAVSDFLGFFSDSAFAIEVDPEVDPDVEVDLRRLTHTRPTPNTGYTGYINSERNIGVPVKGHSAFFGKREDDAVSILTAANVTQEANPKTQYQAQHPRHANECYRVPDRTGGGYWIGDSRKAADSHGVAPAQKRFIAQSSYRHDTAVREAAGVVERRAPIRPPRGGPAGTAGDPAARLSDTSRYDRDYGKRGSNPRQRAPPLNGLGIGAGVSQRATTSDLAGGTARSTKHLPGYAGFIADSGYNPTALDHSDGVLTKLNLKTNALLRALDQYNRDYVPGSTLWRPQHPDNVLVKKTPAPTNATSSGDANHQTWRNGQPTQVQSLGGVSGPGVMGFFTAGVATVSNAGVADAQRFYAVARPLEGVSCNAVYASRTTARGSRFTR